VRRHLDGLKWDVRQRVGEWLTTYLGAEATPYTRAIGRMFLIGMVARIWFYPGVYLHQRSDGSLRFVSAIVIDQDDLVDNRQIAAIPGALLHFFVVARNDDRHCPAQI
jgi:hypothetical protein